MKKSRKHKLKKERDLVKIGILFMIPMTWHELVVTLNIENNVLRFIVWWIPTLICWSLAEHIFSKYDTNYENKD